MKSILKYRKLIPYQFPIDSDSAPVDDPADGRGVEEWHWAAEYPVEHVVVHLPGGLQGDERHSETVTRLSYRGYQYIVNVHILTAACKNGHDKRDLSQYHNVTISDYSGQWTVSLYP